MFKKIAFALFSLNLLTSKPVVAEPLTTIYVCAGILGLIVTYSVGESNGKAEIESKNTKKDNSFKAQAQLASEEHGHILVANSLEKIKAEEIFRKCLIDNRNNSDLGSSRIPKICEDSAKILRLLRRSPEVDNFIKNFQK